MESMFRFSHFRSHRNENGRTVARFGVCRADQWFPSLCFQSGATFDPLAKAQDGTTGNFAVYLPWSLVWARGPCRGGGPGEREHWKRSACFFRVSHMHPWIMDPIPHGHDKAGLCGPPIEKMRHGQKRKPSTGRPSGKPSRRSGRWPGRLACLRSTV
jgi:hypothetical protein